MAERMMKFADGSINFVAVGDKLCRVSGQRDKRTSEITVDKIGREYITCGHSKFSMATGIEKTDICADSVYQSKETYEKFMKLMSKNDKFKSLISRSYHVKWTEDQIDQVVRILDLKLE